MKQNFQSLFLMFLIFTIGCGSSDPQPKKVLLPPKYNYGDQVYAKDSNKICIVINRSTFNCEWKYTIMYVDRQLEYDEEQLMLFEHFDWNKESGKIIQNPSQRGIVD